MDSRKAIYRMYDLFGTAEDKAAICRDCNHLKRIQIADKQKYRCEVFGVIQWRIGYRACGKYNQEFKCMTVERMKKTPKCFEGQIPGQLSLF